MPDRTESILRKACLILAAGLVLRLAIVLFRPNPLAHLVIPELPKLAGDTNAASTQVAMPAKPGSPAGSPTAPTASTNGTVVSAQPGGTNAPQTAGTNVPPKVAGTTNRPSGPTNNAPAIAGSSGAGKPAIPPGAGPGPQLGMPGMPGPMMMGGMPGGRPGATAIPLDPLVTARIDKIIQSEILGPVPHPLPMALMGIAGLDAFIRTPSGQSGMIHEGTNFGGITLLRIGTNRVLVEEGGVKKELLIFEGAGGVSLLTP